MKLMKSMLVGIIGLSMMIAQPGQGSQEPPPEARVFQEAMQQSGGDLEAAYNAVYDFAKKNAMNEQDWNPELFEECAGAAKDALMSTAQDGGSPQDAFRDAMEAAGKCSGEIPPHDPMLMNKVRKYKERNWAPEEGNEDWMETWDDYENWQDWKPRFAPDNEGQMDHNTGGQMDHQGQMDHDGMGNQDGRMDPVAKAFFSVMDSGGNFDEAFKAGERVAKEFDQREGNYDEEQWNKCRDRAYRAGRKAVDEGADPGQVFDAVGRAGNECRDGGPRGEGDHGDQGDDAPNWTFEDVDANGDGVISREEARAKYGIDPQGNPISDFDQQFDNVDSNGSGDVDPK